jgi:hypothetical protein
MTRIIRDGWDAAHEHREPTPLALLEEIATDAGVRFIWSNGKWMVIPDSAVTTLRWMMLLDPEIKNAIIDIVSEHFARGGRP